MQADNHTLTRANFGSHHKNSWKCVWRGYELSLCAVCFFLPVLFYRPLQFGSLRVCVNLCVEATQQLWVYVSVWSDSVIGVTAMMKKVDEQCWRLPSCCIILGSTRWRQMLCGEPCCLERGSSSVRLSSTPLLPLAGLKWREEIWTVKKTERCSYSSLLGTEANLQEWCVTANNYLIIQHCCIIAPLVLNIWTSHHAMNNDSSHISTHFLKMCPIR